MIKGRSAANRTLIGLDFSRLVLLTAHGLARDYRHALASRRRNGQDWHDPTGMQTLPPGVALARGDDP